MPFFKFKDIKIAGVASAVPTEVVATDSYKSRFGDDSVERFKKMTGVQEIRRTKIHQTASDLGFVAAEKIIHEKNINREDIGALVFIAHSTDYRRPATACVLHKRLGLSKDCAAFDVSLGCSAFVYGVQIVCSMMQSSDIDKALLIVGESMTKMVNDEDKSTVMLFGDGGSAVLFEKTIEDEEISVLVKTDGEGYRSIIAPAGGFRNMNATSELLEWPDGNKRTLYNTYMNGTDVFTFTITDVPATIKEFFDKTNTTVGDYGCFAIHQANQYIHKQLSKKLKIPMDKMPLSLDRYGNTSAPAIPLTICDAYGQANDAPKIKMLMCGFGVGLSWGVVGANISCADIYPILETDELYEEGIINSPTDI